MSGYVWRGDIDKAAAEAEAVLERIRGIAAERTGWTPDMTAEVGYAGVAGRFCYGHGRWENVPCRHGNVVTE